MKLIALFLSILLGAGELLAATKTKPNPLNDKFLKMSDAERNAILGGIVHPDPCGTVTRNFFQGLHPNGTAFWSVGCSNGRSYSVSIGADATGSTKVLGCKLLKAVAGVECFKKLEQQ